MSQHPANLAIRFLLELVALYSIGRWAGFRPKACYAEIIFFGFAIWGSFDTGSVTMGRILGGIILIHYIISYDRVGWLLKQ